MSECARCGKLFNGRKFEARYDDVPEHIEKLGGDAQIIRAFFQNVGASRTYVHDICIRCGKVVKRT